MRKAALLIFMTSTLCQAADLGTWGELWPIAEADMLTHIHGRLQAMQESGDLDREQQAFQERAIKNSLRPAPVAGLTPALQDSTHYIDPSFVVSQDLADHQGRVFAHKGERLNPLDSVPFVQTLYFIDGDDQSQIAWLQQQKPATALHKVILVKGDIAQSTVTLDTRVYFDQGGVMSRRLGITAVPARVTAAKDTQRLQVDTFAVEAR